MQNGGVHFTVPRRVEGWVNLGTAVMLCSPCPWLYIAVVFMMNTQLPTVGFESGVSCAAVNTEPLWSAIKQSEDLWNIECYFEAQALPFPGRRISWVSEWVCDFFSLHLLSNGGCKRNAIWHKGSLGDEDDAWTSNTCVAQRKHTIAILTMKNNRHNIIECCDNTHQGAPYTGKQTCACASDHGDASRITCLGLWNKCPVSLKCCMPVEVLRMCY